MGLDAWITTSCEEFIADPTNAGAVVPVSKGDSPSIEICYFREYHTLHEYFESLYFHRGGTQRFNCVTLKLDENDLKQLLKDIINGSLNHTHVYDKNKLLSAIHSGLDLIKDGFTVYYESWW